MFFTFISKFAKFFNKRGMSILEQKSNHRSPMDSTEIKSMFFFFSFYINKLWF